MLAARPVPNERIRRDEFQQVVAVEFLLADGIAEGVVIDRVAGVRDFSGRSTCAPACRQVDAQRAFRAERRVCRSRTQISGVRTEEIQLLERRIA